MAALTDNATAMIPYESQQRRVKVYKLCEMGNWSDFGTGQLEVMELGPTRLVLRVRDEDSGDTLLYHTVMVDIDYGMQAPKLIQWAGKDGVEWALSFLTAEFLPLLLREINTVQDALELAERQVLLSSSPSTSLVAQNMNMAQVSSDDMHLHQESLHHDKTLSVHDLYMNEGEIVLPEPILSNIDELVERFSDTDVSQIMKDRLGERVCKDGYLRRLYEMFEIAEELEKIDDCQKCFEIFKGLVLLGDTKLLDELLSDQNFMRTVAPLEYDPAVSLVLPPGEQCDWYRHRRFLKSTKLVQIVPIHDPDSLMRIRQNYRIAYVKDAILLRFLDDTVLHHLNQVVFYNNCYIATYITEQAYYLQHLMAHLREHLHNKPNDVEYDKRRRVGFCMIRELCNLVKQLPANLRQSCFEAMANAGLFTVVSQALSSCSMESQEWLWLLWCEVFHHFVFYNVMFVRSFLSSQEHYYSNNDNSNRNDSSSNNNVHQPEQLQQQQQGEQLQQHTYSNGTHEAQPLQQQQQDSTDDIIAVMATAITHSSSPGVTVQVFANFRSLLEAEVLAGAPTSDGILLDHGGATGLGMSMNIHNDEFLVHFYRVVLPRIVEVLKAPQPPPMSPASSDLMTRVFYVIELLSVCVKRHEPRVRPMFKHENLLGLVAKQLHVCKRDVVMSALRFIRTIISLGDPFHMQRIVEERVLDDVVELFVANGSRYNMLNSVIINMIEFICERDVKSLIVYLVETHGSKFESVRYVDTFDKLQRMYVELHQQPLNASQDAYEELFREADRRRRQDLNESEQVPPSPPAQSELDKPAAPFIERRSMLCDVEEEDFMSLIARRSQQQQQQQQQTQGQPPRKQRKLEMPAVLSLPKLVDYDYDSDESDDETTNTIN